MENASFSWKQPAFGDTKTKTGFTRRLYWEKRAGKYPRPFERGTRLRTDRVIGLLEKRHPSIAGGHILDVGSGTGIFTLPFAQLGASVTALDISGNMLRVLTAEARRHRISGVNTIQASWKDIVPGARLNKAFDVVFTSLSVAVETEADLFKMEKCSNRWCVVVATGKITRPPFIEKALRRLELPLAPRPDVRRIREVLTRMGRSVSYDVFPVFIHEKKTVFQIAEDMTRRLESYGKKTNRDKIWTVFSSLFPGIRPNTVLSCNRRTDIGVLIWRANEG